MSAPGVLPACLLDSAIEEFLILVASHLNFVLVSNWNEFETVIAEEPDTVSLQQGDYDAGITIVIVNPITIESFRDSKPVIVNAISIQSDNVVLRNLECALVERGQHNGTTTE